MRWAPNSTTLGTVVVAALLTLLPLMAVLQYQWIGQVSEAGRERMRANLNNATSQFAQEFNHELSRVSLAFQAARLSPEEDTAEKLAAQYDQWGRTAPYPNFVRKLSFVEIGEGAELEFQNFNPQSDELDSAPWPSGYADLKRSLASLAQGRIREAGMSGRPSVWTLGEQTPALILPVYQFIRRSTGTSATKGSPDSFARPRLVGCTVIELNFDFLKNHLLPDLVHKYFGQGDDLDYQLAVVDRNEPNRIVYQSDSKPAPDLFTSPDASVYILGLRPQPLFRFMSGRGAGAQETRPEKSGSNTEPRGDSPARKRNTGRRSSAQSNLALADFGQWQVVVKHRSGSLEEAVSGVRRRNLAISFGILVLLSGSVGMILLSTRRAQRLARLQMEFVAGVSHELRTPLAVICSAADNLADGVVGPGRQIQKYGSLIRNEGRRLSGMIDQILGFAAVQSSRKKFDLRPVDAAAIIDEALQAACTGIQKPEVQVSREIPGDLPPVIADPGPLSNCIQNLLNNAFKYGGDSGWIRIRAEVGDGDHGPEVRISVEDRGPGIEPGDLPHIFEPFYRGSKVVAAQIHGTGLGLSLVKRMMEAQGGAVRVKSEPGTGAVFTLHLPAAGVPLPAAS